VSVRVGIDVGGTFTDLVAIDPASGAVRSRKVLTTPEAPARGVLAGLQALAPGAGSIAHGTTIVTNAIVEGRHARTALVTTRGFRDVLEIARQSRQELYRLDVPPRPAPLVPRHLRLEVTERVLADGRVAVALAEDELPALAAALRASGVERRGCDYFARWISAVAIFPCAGNRDEASERALAEAFAKGGWQQVTRLYRDQENSKLSSENIGLANDTA
jgi:N-methylhydantoinase A/oxoprolinase/acetone carboxylase beta subunit